MADDRYFYPESEREPNNDKPKGPYVKFLKTKRHHLGSQRKPNEPEYNTVDEPCYYPIGTAPNTEAIDNFRATGARVIGYGNLPRRAPFGTIRSHLHQNTELMFDVPENPMRKHLEAKIRAEIAEEKEAEVVAVENGEASLALADVTPRKGKKKSETPLDAVA